MPILNGNDIEIINEFATKHKNEWIISGKSTGFGMVIVFKDDSSFAYNDGIFKSFGSWDFEKERTKHHTGTETKQQEEVIEEEEVEEQEQEE